MLFIQKICIAPFQDFYSEALLIKLGGKRTNMLTDAVYFTVV